MGFKKWLIESPQLLDGGTDFGMGDKSFNRSQTQKWLKKKVEDFGEDTFGILFRTGDNQNGYYILYNKETKLTDYFIKYEYKKISGAGPFITQVLLWRRLSATFKDGSITNHVFFDILLKKYNQIASDQQQTEDGKRFWIRMMSIAHRKGHKIGIAEQGKIIYFDPKELSYDDWIEQNELDSWGEEESKRMIRFIIDQKK